MKRTLLALMVTALCGAAMLAATSAEARGIVSKSRIKYGNVKPGTSTTSRDPNERGPSKGTMPQRSAKSPAGAR